MASFRVHNELGRWGEDCAQEYLRAKDYHIHARNWYNPRGKRHGEIDIVAQKDGMLVFVEVKTLTASTNTLTQPEAQITRQKLYKLNHICNTYIKQYGLWTMPWRIDAIAIVYTSRSDYELRHLKHIFF